MDIKNNDIVEIRLISKERNFWSYVKEFDGSHIEIYQPLANNLYTPINIGDEIELVVMADKTYILFKAIVKDLFKSSPSYFRAKIKTDIKIIENKRETLRVCAKIPFKFWKSKDGISKLGDEFVSITKDISPSGCSFEIDDDSIKVGDYLYIEFDFTENTAKSFAVVAKKDDLKESFLISVFFINIDETSQSVITRAVYNYQRIFGFIGGNL